MSAEVTDRHPSPPSSAAIAETFPLGLHWPTLDPFLFVAHHRDDYPSGTPEMTPDAGLDGRDIGSDFSDKDGWSMYHGDSVPGFPAHPHRGFETITYVRRGLIDHSDSLGATARYGRGDTQWLTTGAGVVHSEMFPLIEQDSPNPTEVFQIWLNLPARSKFADPYFTMFWADSIPEVTVAEGVAVTAIAGTVPGAGPSGEPLPPPPDSWASQPDADVSVWHVRMRPGSRWMLPRAEGDTSTRMLYAFEGDSVEVHGLALDAGTGARLTDGREVELVAGGGGVEILLLGAVRSVNPSPTTGPSS
ncbi:MAG: pirin family protein [Microthrixaceae bacterium]|nr:pirin family protein [Microthrixaceae bacterium]